MILTPSTLHAGTLALAWARGERLTPERTVAAIFDAMARSILPGTDAAVAFADFVDWGESNRGSPLGGERPKPLCVHTEWREDDEGLYCALCGERMEGIS